VNALRFRISCFPLDDKYWQNHKVTRIKTRDMKIGGEVQFAKKEKMRNNRANFEHLNLKFKMGVRKNG